ncbi:collagen alpha-1(X) chain-like [Mercenaria mercenaria]|uniref:collagen alpha-1(X) chain-like n=1 Tax=Mercenaria mercenaria TaxID=6596 RepID=UPI00234E8CA2|nr:collagen alpha-1(X) chain-like [Mercenaria mercenaria]
MFAHIVLLVTVCACVSSSEPECSRFHYEEKTLEKMIKTEIYVDKIKSETENMQQKMSEKLDGIQEAWKKTERELKDAIADNKMAVQEIKDEKDVSTTQMPVVAFQSYFLKETSIENGQTLIFTKTVYDKGLGYNNRTGVYTTPVSGVYLFSVQLCIFVDKFVHVEIVHEDATIIKVRLVDEDQRYHSCSTVTGVAVLSKGERVWVKSIISSTGENIWRNPDIVWNSFSGVLINRSD